MHTWRKVGCCLFAAVAAFGAMADVPLPAGYTRVEYLASTDGKPWVNTGFTVTTNEWEYVLDTLIPDFS